MSEYHRRAGYNSREARAHWLPLLPLPCSRCGGVVDKGMRWDVDHIMPLSAGGPVNDRNNEWPSHRYCNQSHGSAIAKAKMRADKAVDQRFLEL